MRMDARSGPGLQHSAGTKPRQRCPRPTPIPLSAPCCRRSAPYAAARNLVYTTNPAARRKASSVHVHRTAARPEPAGPFPSPQESKNVASSEEAMQKPAMLTSALAIDPQEGAGVVLGDVVITLDIVAVPPAALDALGSSQQFQPAVMP